MPTEKEKQLKGIVDASGFAFQLSIMSNIQKTIENHHWEIFTHEHPWHDNATGDGGYIDLILKQHSVRLIIECKRTKDASWVFLNPDNKHDKILFAKCLWSDLYEIPNFIQLGTKGEVLPGPVFGIASGWYDFRINQLSPESEFCVIRGTGEKDTPLLERLCGQLLKSTECLSAEEMDIQKRKLYSNLCIYVPIIVTNAHLWLCHFDPKKVSLSDGLLKDGKFEEVPFIRFRKSLTTILSPKANPLNLIEANKDKERTVLIINANHLCDILVGIELVVINHIDAPWNAYPRRSS